MPDSCLLADALRTPSILGNLSEAAWDRLVTAARTGQLLPRLAWLVRTQDLVERLPAFIADFLPAHEAVADAQHEAVHYEAGEILRATEPIDAPVIFLKGSAYVLSAHPARYGRLLGDIDIMVPRNCIDNVEMRLKLRGWSNAHYSAYDQRYYRQWMHELPALRHSTRSTMLDVHHTILPPTSSTRLDAARLFEMAQPIPGLSGAFVLSPVDMLIHCAAHLFHEGEFEKGLRDLHDFHQLLSAYIAMEASLSLLAERALDLDLAWPLYLALRCERAIFATQHGESAIQTLGHRLCPGRLHLWMMDTLYHHALPAHDPRATRARVNFARWLLYIRSHWLRMPPTLLALHLGRKALSRRIE
jgi:hypothetical protein